MNQAQVQETTSQMTFDMKVEIVGQAEAMKFDGNETWYKHEAYLHTPEKKYPQANDIYMRDEMAEGDYVVQAELYVSKGKLQIRKEYIKAGDVKKPTATDAKKKA